MAQEKQAPDGTILLPPGSSTEQKLSSGVEREVTNPENETIAEIRESVQDTPTQDTPTTLRTGEVKPMSTIEHLNEFMRGELASVETYHLALQALDSSEWAETLREIRDNHEIRVHILRKRIRALGGDPVQSSGVWGAFGRAIQRSADLLGQRVALAALEEGETQLLKRYGRETGELQLAEREFVERELLPLQVHTCDLARSLEKLVKAA